MQITVNFYSYFRDLTGATEATETIEANSTIADLLKQLFKRFPKLEAMQNSMLVAVGLEYAARDHPLQEGDQVSLFPPVQGG
jgi:MoaD family protein